MKRLIIIGGGFAGSRIAKRLEPLSRTLSVTLIDTKDFFEFTPGILRTIVEPDHLRKVQVLHSHYLRYASLLTDTVTDVSYTHVHTPHHRLAYDYLVIASGSTYRQPIKDMDVVASARARDLRDAHGRLRRARSVLIVGGGIVGVELAAEIVEQSNAQVTIVDAGTRIMSRSPPRAQAYAEAWLTRHGVQLIYGQRLKEKKRQAYVTEDGTTLGADLVFFCTGITPNTTFLSSFLAGQLQRGYVPVDTFLQVPGHPRVFAAGDCVAIREEKLAQTAEEHARIVTNNILAMEQGRALLTYTPHPRIMVISLGKRDGILVQKNGTVRTGRIVGTLKQAIEWKAMRAYR